MTEEQKERNRKLVAALRGGTYKQGKGCLRDGNRFCCLGVASNLYAQDELVDSNDRRAAWGNAYYPNEKVTEYYGWDSPNPRFASGSTAAELNDWGTLFATIAYLFEQKYLGDTDNEPRTT